MPIETTRDEARSLTTHAGLGEVTMEELLDAMSAFYEQGPTTLVMWDMTRLERPPEFGADEARLMVAKAAEHGPTRPGGRTALVAPSDLTFGLGRMTQAYTDSQPDALAFRVFRNREQALAWLFGDEDPASQD